MLAEKKCSTTLGTERRGAKLIKSRSRPMYQNIKSLNNLAFAAKTGSFPLTLRQLSFEGAYFCMFVKVVFKEIFLELIFKSKFIFASKFKLPCYKKRKRQISTALSLSPKPQRISTAVTDNAPDKARGNLNQNFPYYSFFYSPSTKSSLFVPIRSVVFHFQFKTHAELQSSRKVCQHCSCCKTRMRENSCIKMIHTINQFSFFFNACEKRKFQMGEKYLKQI